MQALIKNTILNVIIVCCFFVVSKTVQADIFAPSSCNDLSSSDVVTNMFTEIETRIDGITAQNSTKQLFSTLGNDSNPWERNASVWTARGTTTLDFSGVSPWNSTFSYIGGGTLITPRHIVFAHHAPIANGSTVVFVAPDNTRITRTLQNHMAVVKIPLVDDIEIGVLDSDVPSSIAFYPILLQSEAENYFSSDQIPVAVTDQENKMFVRDIYYNQYTGNGHALIGNFAPPTNSARYLFQESLVSGDSGRPGFWIINGQPLLAFTVTGFNTGPFYGAYVDELNNAITALGNDGGYQVSTYDLSCFDQNNTPSITSETFTLEENSALDTLVGTINATDSNSDTSLSFSILSGNIDNAFDIDTDTGTITIASTSVIDYEINPSFSLVVEVTDNWLTPLSATGTITILLEDVDETPVDAPTVSTGVASAVSSTEETLVGSVTATGGENPTERGFRYGTSATYGATTTESGDFSIGDFSYTLTSLSCNTTYHFSAWARNNSGGVGFGNDQTFTTENCPRSQSGGRGGGGGGGGGGSKEKNISKESTSATAPSGSLSSLLIQLKTILHTFIAAGGTLTPHMASFLTSDIVPPTQRELTVGDRGADVFSLQKRLIEQGAGPASKTLAEAQPSGYFGGLTKNALIEFQATHGVPLTGIFDERTQSILPL